MKGCRVTFEFSRSSDRSHVITLVTAQITYSPSGVPAESPPRPPYTWINTKKAVRPPLLGSRQKGRLVRRHDDMRATAGLDLITPTFMPTGYFSG